MFKIKEYFSFSPCILDINLISQLHLDVLVHQVKAIEYTDCISADEYDFSNECPEYYTKQSDLALENLDMVKKGKP